SSSWLPEQQFHFSVRDALGVRDAPTIRLRRPGRTVEAIVVAHKTIPGGYGADRRSFGLRPHRVGGPAIVPRQEVRRHLLELGAADATRARGIAHGKFERRQRHALVKVLVPRVAPRGGRGDLLDDGPAQPFECLERATGRAGCFHGAMQGNRVLECESRARSDTEVHAPQRIAHEYPGTWRRTF